MVVGKVVILSRTTSQEDNNVDSNVGFRGVRYLILALSIAMLFLALIDFMDVHTTGSAASLIGALAFLIDARFNKR